VATAVAAGTVVVVVVVANIVAVVNTVAVDSCGFVVEIAVATADRHLYLFDILLVDIHRPLEEKVVVVAVPE
jgi:hypothetical protein